MLRRLAKITIMPTATIIDLTDILLETRVAIGEATALPIIKPRMASHCRTFSMVTNVSELNSAIKNLEYFTVPKENLGFLPPAIRDDKTIEPQPPPPTASTNPPPKPNSPIRLIFLFFLSDFFLFALKAFERIIIPKMKV